MTRNDRPPIEGKIVVRETGAVAAPRNEGSDAKAEALRGEIERTRSSMSGTIDEIEQRLSPARLKEQLLEQFHDAKERVKSEVREDFDEAKQRVHHEIDEAKHAMRDATIGRVEHMVHRAGETINDTGNSIVGTIRANPIPAVLAGVGLAWLFMSARNGASRGGRVPQMSRGQGDPLYRGRPHDDGEGMLEHGRQAVGEAIHRASDVASQAAHTVRDAAGSVVDQAGTAISHTGERIGALAHDAGERGMVLAHQTKAQAVRFERGVEHVYQENPLAVGAAALALGVVAGLAIPHTHREDELMGGTRDRLLEKASHLAEDAVGSARDKVGGAIDELGAKSDGDRPSVKDATKNDVRV